MDKFQDGRKVEEIRKVSLEEARRKMVGFRNDPLLYPFWRNVYRTLQGGIK